MRSHDTSRMPRPGKTYRAGFTASLTLFLLRGGPSRVRFHVFVWMAYYCRSIRLEQETREGKCEHVTHARRTPAAVAAVLQNYNGSNLSLPLFCLHTHTHTHSHTHTHYLPPLFPDLRHPDKGSLNEGGRERDTSSFDGFPSPRDNDGAEDGMVSRSAPNASVLQRTYSLE